MLEGLKHLLHARHTSLADVSDPTAVALHARVASPNAVRSPFSGMAAAVFHVDFFVEHAPDNKNQPEHVTEYVGSVLIGGDLMVEADGLRVLLPGRRFRLEFEGAAGDGVTLDRPLPPGCEHIAKSPLTARGALRYRELSLSHGEEVELVATVAKVHRGGGYRDVHVEAGAPFEAQPDLAEVLVRYKMPSFA